MSEEYFQGQPIHFIKETFCMHAQSCLNLCDLMECSPSGSSSLEISRQQYWNRLPFPPSGDLPDLGNELNYPEVHVFPGGFFTTELLGKPRKITR